MALSSVFEYILEPGRLSSSLGTLDHDSRLDLVLQFLHCAQPPREISAIEGGNHSLTIKDPILSKKSVALRVLSLKAMAFFKWNITSEDFRERFPNYLLQTVVQDLLVLVRGGVQDVEDHANLNLEELPPEALFAINLCHRWIINNYVYQDGMVKQRALPPNLGPVALNSNLNNMGIGSQQVENTQRFIVGKTEESCQILERLLKCATPYMPTMSAFISPNPHNPELIVDWEQVVHIKTEEYQLQLHYDLGCYYIFKRMHSEAAKHFRAAAVLFNQIEPSSFDYCTVVEKKLSGYLTACEVTLKHDMKAQSRFSVERLEESLRNNYSGLLDVLAEDNKLRQLPLHTRDALELDLIGSASSGILLDSETLVLNVQYLNIVRRVVDGVPFTQNIEASLASSRREGAPAFMKYFEDVYPTLGQAQKTRVRNFLYRLGASPVEAGSRVLKALIESKLNVLFSSDQLTDLSEGRFFPCEPPGDEPPKGDVTTEAGRADLLQRLISCYDVAEIRELLSTIGRATQGKQVWMLSTRWEIPIPFQSTIMGLPKGFVQDFAYILLAKARELLNQEEYFAGQSLISAIEEEVRPWTLQQNVPATQSGFSVGTKLLRLLQWESLLINCARAVKEWPKRTEDERSLITQCKHCLSTVSGEITNSVNVLPRSEVIEYAAALLLACGEWDFLIPLTNVNRFAAASLEHPATLAATSLEIARNRERPNRVIANTLWELVSSAFGKPPGIGGQKRGSSGAVVGDVGQKTHNLANFCLRLCEPVTLSVMISCLSQLHNVVRDESGQEMTVEYSGFWPPNLPNPTGYSYQAVSEVLQLLTERALKLHPINPFWLRVMGDLHFAQNDYAASMRWYLEACSGSSDFFCMPVPKPIMDEALIRRMIKACQKMQKLTEAAILCQFLDPPDYAVAFKCLHEKTSCDAMDALYPCIWDMAILEYLTAQHTKRGEPKADATILQTGLPELNSNNNEEIQREAMSQRRSRFLRGLAREYMVI